MDDIDDEHNEPIKATISTCIRVKPLGAGAGDVEEPNDKFANKVFSSFDRDNHTITISDKKGKGKVFKFPELVAPPEYD